MSCKPGSDRGSLAGQSAEEEGETSDVQRADKGRDESAARIEEAVL